MKLYVVEINYHKSGELSVYRIFRNLDKAKRYMLGEVKYVYNQLMPNDRLKDFPVMNEDYIIFDDREWWICHIDNDSTFKHGDIGLTLDYMRGRIKEVETWDNKVKP